MNSLQNKKMRKEDALAETKSSGPDNSLMGKIKDISKENDLHLEAKSCPALINKIVKVRKSILCCV